MLNIVDVYENITFELVKELAQVGSKPGMFRIPYGIAYDEKSGNYFVSDCINNTIKKYNNKGSLLKEWGSKGSKKEEFNYPADLLITQKNELLISDEKNHKIHRYDLNGNFLGVFSKYGYGTGHGQLNNPLGMAEDSKGNIYVVDSLNVRVQKYDQDGIFIKTFAGSLGNKSAKPSEFYGPYYMAIDSNDRVYVTDTSLNRVSVYDKNGKIITLLGVDYSSGELDNPVNFDDRPGRFSSPNYIQYEKDSDVILISDVLNDRVQVFDNNFNLVSIINLPGARPKISLLIPNSQSEEDLSIEGLDRLYEKKMIIGSGSSKKGILTEWALSNPATLEVKVVSNNSKEIDNLLIENPLSESLSQLLDKFKGKHEKHQYNVHDLFYIPDSKKRSRSIFIPKGKKIVKIDDSYTIPPDTLFLTEVKNSITDKLIETRVLLFGEDEYMLGSYTPNNNDSILLRSYKSTTSQECLFCHISTSNGLLGFTPEGLVSDDIIELIEDKSKTLVEDSPLSRIRNMLGWLPYKNESHSVVNNNFAYDALKYLNLNCSYCHNGKKATNFDIEKIGVALSGVENFKELPRDFGLFNVVDLNDTSRSKIIQMLSLGLMPYGAEDSDEKGIYLLKMLINSTSEDFPKHIPLPGGAYTPTYIDLKIKEKFFDIEGLHAVQGVEFRGCCNDKVFAQGYVNSLGMLNNEKEFQFKKIENIKDDLIALSSDISTDILGNIYVTSYRNGTVTRFDKNLNNPLVIINNLNYPLGISTRGNDIITINSADHEIIKSDLSGNIEWRREYTGDGLHNPYGVEMTSENIFVTFNKESVIVKMDLDGNILKMIGPSLPDGTVMSNIQSVSIGPKGNIYVIDTRNTRIVIFDDNLEYVAVAFDNNIDSMRGLDVNNMTGEIMASGFSLESPSVTEGNSGIFIFNPVFDMLNNDK